MYGRYARWSRLNPGTCGCRVLAETWHKWGRRRELRPLLLSRSCNQRACIIFSEREASVALKSWKFHWLSPILKISPDPVNKGAKVTCESTWCTKLFSRPVFISHWTFWGVTQFIFRAAPILPPCGIPVEDSLFVSFSHKDNLYYNSYDQILPNDCAVCKELGRKHDRLES